jgi:hypothetical protein
MFFLRASAGGRNKKMVLLCILYGVGLTCIHNILCFLVLEADCFRVGTHHIISLSVLIIFSDLGRMGRCRRRWMNVQVRRNLRPWAMRRNSPMQF